MIVTQPQTSVFSLAPGEALTVSADAISAGLVIRLGNSAGGAQQGGTSIAASESHTFGPYTTATRFHVIPTTGALTATQGPASAENILDSLSTIEINSDGDISARANEILGPTSAYEDVGSYQPIAVDLELAAAGGTSDAGDTAFLAPAMFNLLGADLTKTNNYLAGLIAALSVTGARATVLPLAALLAVLMDGTATADGIVTAHIDGGDPSTQTNARAAFAVSVFNNHASSGVEYGLDLFFTPSAEVDALLSGTAIGFAPSKGAIRFPNGQWLVTLETAITANVTTTDAPNGSMGLTSHATGVGKLFMSDGSKWQFAVVA